MYNIGQKVTLKNGKVVRVLEWNQIYLLGKTYYGLLVEDSSGRQGIVNSRQVNNKTPSY